MDRLKKQLHYLNILIFRFRKLTMHIKSTILDRFLNY